MNNSLFFSVIIPTCHRNNLLSKCLDCLDADIQSISCEQYEVIVTDDGLETTAEIMIKENYTWVKWYEGPHKGPAANRNNGSKYARGEWLVFTDDDCLPDPQWLLAYNEGIKENPSCKVFEGRTYVDRPRQSLAEKAPSNETGGYLWSCNFAIEKKLFYDLQGFDERFPYAAMEDVDLNYRIIKNGLKKCFLESASVCHPWRRVGSWKYFSHKRESTYIYLTKYPDEVRRLSTYYFVIANLRELIYQTLPYLIRYRGKGLKSALINHISLILETWMVLKNFEYKYVIRNLF